MEHEHREHRPRTKTEREFLIQINDKLDRILKGERTLMALTQAETDAINKLSTDIDTALAAATGHDAALQAIIDDLTAQRDALQANDTADAAQIASLTQSVNDLQAALDSHSSDVVDALTGLDDHVNTITPTA